jgi:hypothetical protein
VKVKNMQQITSELIASLEPCKERHQNYLKHYKNKTLSLKEFLQLEHLTYTDKLWVWNRVASKDIACKWALTCALTSLPFFEAKYPNDRRPREALEAMQQLMKDPSLMKNCWAAANKAAEAFIEMGFKREYEAQAAAHSACCAAHTAYTAFHENTTVNNTARSQAIAAANAAAEAAYLAHKKLGISLEQQEKINLEMLVKLYEEES